MAGLIDPNDIAKARQSGYSDNEIASFLSEKHPEQFKAARDAGYHDNEIIAHLSGDSEKPSGFGAGFAHGMSGVPAGLASTLGLAGVNTDGLDAAASKLEPKNYKSASILRDGISAVPQVIAENLPGLATDIAAAKAGSTLGSVGGIRGKALGGTAGFLGSMLLRTFGPGAHENAKARTGDENAPVTSEDMLREGAKQALMAPINATAAGRFMPSKVAGVGLEGAGNALKKYLTTAGVETAAGGGRDAVNQAVTNVGQEHGAAFDPERAAEAALASGATGSAFVTPRAAADVASASKFRKFGGDNSEAATALANRQIEAADGKKLIGPLGGTKTAGAAVAAAHADVHEELAAASKGEDLSTSNANTLQRIKAGGDASQGELDALSREASPEVVHLARQALLSKELMGMGEMKDGKFNGGLSGLMEQKLRPIYNPTATLASTAAATLGAGMLPGMIGMSAPHVVGGVYGAYGLARLADKLTGARSPAQGFTDKFGDPTAAIRTPEPQAAPTAPVTTSVPQVTPPQNTALWGNPEAPQPTLRATLNSNAKVEEGMAKIAAQLAAQKKAGMVADATPLLKQLASKIKPVAEPAPEPEPTWGGPSPIAKSMLQQTLKQGLPTEPPEAPAPAPTPPDAFDALKPLMGRQRAVMRGLSAASKQQIQDNIAQRKAAGIAQAEGLAGDSHLINENGGLDALSNPEFTKRGSQLISAANVMKKLTAVPKEDAATVSDAPASPLIASVMAKMNGSAPITATSAANTAPISAPPAMAGNSAPTSMADILSNINASGASNGAPKPPVIASINKKLNGKVTEAQYAEEAQPYEPVENKWRKGLSDQAVADKALAQYEPAAQKKYSKTIIENRAGHRSDLEAIARDNPADGAAIEALYHDLDHVSSRAKARKSITHFTHFMSAQAAKAVHARYTDKLISQRWKD